MSGQAHPTAVSDGAVVGSGLVLDAYAYVEPGAVVGDSCHLGPQVLVTGDAHLGNRVRLGAGVRVLGGARIEDDAVVGPNTVIGSPLPRENGAPPAPATIRAGAVIGANCSVATGVVVGLGAVVSDGTPVSTNVPPHAVVRGAGSRIVAYADERTLDVPHTGLPRRDEAASYDVVGPGGSRLLPLRAAADLRGALVAAEWPAQLPFSPERIFAVFDVPSEFTRGEHAHRTCEQFLICLAGSIAAVADDGTARREFTLDSPRVGLYLPAGVWCTQYRHTSDAVLLVLASHAYDETDYIRDYDTFLAEIAQR